MKLATLTPNPALDLSGRVQQLIPNEKNYVSHERKDPGGNGINAARVAARLGTSTLALGFLGGSIGDEIQYLLDKEKVPTAFTPIRGHTRVNVTVSNQATHQQTRLTFPGPRISGSEIRMLKGSIRKLKGPGLFMLGGSLPPGCPPSFHSEIAQVAAKAGFGLIVDIPSRFLTPFLKNNRSEPLNPILIKPNQTELEEWYGRPLTSDGELVKAARDMARRSSTARSATLVCVSLAERGAILATAEHAWFGVAPRVRAKGTVGAGDSMVGAMAARLLHFRLVTPERLAALVLASRPVTPRGRARLPAPLEDMLKWGLAAGAATAKIAGTALAQPSEIRRLARQVRIRPLR